MTALTIVLANVLSDIALMTLDPRLRDRVLTP